MRLDSLGAVVIFLITGLPASTFGTEVLSQDEPITPLPLSSSVKITDAVRLGKILFSDPRLSKSGTISCASCHNLKNGGMDGRAKSLGIDGAVGEINAPTVLNSVFNFRQFWNGRAVTLEDQVDGPVQNPKEMGADWNDVVNKLKSDTHYHASFQNLFPDGVTKANIKTAIATFERALITPNSRFDRYLRGETAAITAVEKEGYVRFKTYGCISCHQGMNIGGNMFQTIGVMAPYFKDRGGPITTADLGRYTVTHQERDRYVFRVPSLRNVELTAPYFHDASAPTLEAAVSTMAKYQLGRHLEKNEIDSIVAFLKTLTGERPIVLDLDSEGGRK